MAFVILRRGSVGGVCVCWFGRYRGRIGGHGKKDNYDRKGSYQSPNHTLPKRGHLTTPSCGFPLLRKGN
jgi:hypothetical protein